MNKEKMKPKDDDLEKVEEALKRAAENARKIAQQTGTTLVIFKNGRIIKEKVV